MHSKGNHWQNEKTPIEWEKISANNKTNNGLISKIHKQFNNSTSKKQTYWFLKMGRRPRDFSQGDIQMLDRHMKKCSASLIIRAMQIKTTIRYHLTPVRMAINKKNTNNKWCKDVEKREPSHSIGEKVNWSSLFGKQYGGFSRN